MHQHSLLENLKMKNHHFLLILQGLLGILLGAALIIWPIKSLVAVTWFAGAFLIIDAIILVLYSFFTPNKKNTELFLVEGVLALIFGILIIAWPDQALRIMVFIFAVWALAMGIVQIVKGIFSKDENVQMMKISVFTGLFGLLVGFLLFAFPLGTILIVQIVIGLIILVFGISNFVYAFKVDR